MPSVYCQNNPASFICNSNPNYNPQGGGGIINPFPMPSPLPDYGGGSPYPQFPTISVTPLPYPKGTPTTTLDKILASSLSALALLRGSSSIPTAQQQQQYGGYDAYQLALLQQQQLQGGYGGGSNTGAKIENWVKNNTGVVIIGVGALALYLLPSPKKR